MEVKPPATFNEQMEKLKKRGCSITDERECIQILQCVNYYRLTAYFLPFKQSDDTYLSGTSFSRVYRIYEFDRKLRWLLFSVLEEIEIKLRTCIAYFHSHKYGSLGYLEPANFNQKHNHERFIEKLETEIENNKEVPFVKHHIEKYERKFPLWVAIELFSFGMLSYFYSDLKSADMREIAKCDFSQHPVILKSWLRCCTDLRNICAHYAAVPVTPKGHFELRNRIFDYIVVLKYLYPHKEHWNNETLLGLRALVDEYSDSVELGHIGFPPDWFDLLEN